MNETKSTCDSSFQDANKGIGAGFRFVLYLETLRNYTMKKDTDLTRIISN